MDTDRRLAIGAGVAFIVATVAQLAGVAFVSSVLTTPVDLTRIAAHDRQVLFGAFLQFVGAVACPTIAIALYPVLRRASEGLALASVGFRTIEGTLHVLIAMCLMALVTFGQDSAAATASGVAAFQADAGLVMTARTWLGPLSVLTFGLGGLAYSWVFVRTGLVPRWLAVWGLAGVLLVMASAVLVMFQVIVAFSTAQIILALPIAIQEMVLAVWLIAKGFAPLAVARARTDAPSRAAAVGPSEPATWAPR